MTNEPQALEAADDIALADRLRDGRTQIMGELKKQIVGQEDVVDQVLLSLIQAQQGYVKPQEGQDNVDDIDLTAAV